MSFSVEEDALNFDRVYNLINQRSDILALLNFAILNVSQGKQFLFLEVGFYVVYKHW